MLLAGTVLTKFGHIFPIIEPCDTTTGMLMSTETTKPEIVGRTFDVEYRSIIGEVSKRRVTVSSKFSADGVTFFKGRSMSDGSLVTYRMDQVLKLTAYEGVQYTIGGDDSAAHVARKADRFPLLNDCSDVVHTGLFATIKRMLSFAH